MKLAADFRTQARQALRGKWLMAVLAGLLAALLGGTALEGPEIKFNFNPGAGVGRVSLNYVGRELASVGMDMDLRFSGWLVGAAVYLTIVYYHTMKKYAANPGTIPSVPSSGTP